MNDVTAHKNPFDLRPMTEEESGTIRKQTSRKIYQREVRELEATKLGLNDLQILSNEDLIPEDLDLLIHANKKYLPFTIEITHPEGWVLVLMTRHDYQLNKLTELYNEYHISLNTEKAKQTREKIDRYQGKLYKFPPSAIDYFCESNRDTDSKVIIRCQPKTFVTSVGNIQESVLYIRKEWSELLRNNKITIQFY